jgi:hypothetical protein
MLTLNNRPCRIGPSINTRSEMHGDESVPAMAIPLSSIMLTPSELNALLDEPLAHGALFSDRADQLSEPLFKRLAPLKLKDKFEECTVAILVGLNRKLITLEHVKLAKLTLDPQVGGSTALSLAVQCTPKLDSRINHLLAFLNCEAEVEIVTGQRAAHAAKQPELALGGPGDDDDDGEDEAEEVRGGTLKDGTRFTVKKSNGKGKRKHIPRKTKPRPQLNA